MDPFTATLAVHMASAAVRSWSQELAFQEGVSLEAYAFLADANDDPQGGLAVGLKKLADSLLPE